MVRARRQRAHRGFTLIEILSVVAILALLAALVAPNLGAVRSRALRGEAQSIAAQLELARQRAIVTGVPHRLWLDLDEAEYRLEWLAADPDAPPPEPVEIDLRGNSPISLEAPRDAELRFQPVPGNFGRLQIVADPFYFEALETPTGRVTGGEAHIAFERDGTASYTEVYLQDAQGHQVALDVYPLDERVRIRHDL